MKDKSMTKLMIKLELSDLIFKQHIKGYMPVNIFIIAIQVIVLIVSLIVQTFTDLRIGLFSAYLNLILLLVVGFNNYIHNRAWNEAKEKLNSDIEFGLTVLAKEDKDNGVQEKSETIQKEQEN